MSNQDDPGAEKVEEARKLANKWGCTVEEEETQDGHYYIWLSKSESTESSKMLRFGFMRDKRFVKDGKCSVRMHCPNKLVGRVQFLGKVERFNLEMEEKKKKEKKEGKMEKREGGKEEREDKRRVK